MLLETAGAWCLQGGCIIRAGFLDDIKNAYKRNPDLENLVLDEWFANKLAERQDAWRDVVKIAITNGQSQSGLRSLSDRQKPIKHRCPGMRHAVLYLLELCKVAM